MTVKDEERTAFSAGIHYREFGYEMDQIRSQTILKLRGKKTDPDMKRLIGMYHDTKRRREKIRSGKHPEFIFPDTPKCRQEFNEGARDD